MARYMVAEEFHGSKWYMVEMVRFSENYTVFKRYGTVRFLKPAVNLPCRALENLTSIHSFGLVFFFQVFQFSIRQT